MTSLPFTVLLALGLLAAGLAYCLVAIFRLRREVQALLSDRLPPSVESNPVHSAALSSPPLPVPAPPAPPALVSSSPPARASEPSIAEPASPVLAVIAAAVHSALGGRYRIVSVVPAVAAASASWSVEGRRDVFSSHQVR